jgi:hypothetical protein
LHHPDVTPDVTCQLRPGFDLCTVPDSQARLAVEDVVEEPGPLPPPDVNWDDRDPLDELSAAHSDQAAEVVLRMLDWMGVSKNTWTSAEQVWDML